MIKKTLIALATLALVLSSSAQGIVSKAVITDTNGFLVGSSTNLFNKNTNLLVNTLSGTIFNGGVITNLTGSNLVGVIPQASLPAAVVTNNQPTVSFGAINNSSTFTIVSGSGIDNSGVFNGAGDIRFGDVNNLYGYGLTRLSNNAIYFDRQTLYGDGSGLTNVQATNIVGLPTVAAGTNLVIVTNSSALTVSANLNLTNSYGTLPQASLPGSVITNTYYLKSFGAYGDAQYANHAYCYSNTTAVEVGYGHFTVNDIGAFCVVKGAGINRRDFWTGISNVIDANHIVLSNVVYLGYTNTFAVDTNIQAWSVGYPIIYGKHDDTAAIQGWLNQITNGGGRFDAGEGTYLVLGGLKLPNYAQLVVPVPGWNGNKTNQALNMSPVMEIVGHGNGLPWFSAGAGELNIPNNCTVFVSNLQGGDGTNACGTNLIGNSFLDFRAYNPGNTPWNIFNNSNPKNYYWPNNVVHLWIHDLTILMGYDCNAVGLNLIGATESSVQRVNIYGSCSINTLYPAPTGTNGWGLILPGNFNGTGREIDDNQILGFYNCIDLGLGFGNYNTLGVAINGFTDFFSGAAAHQPFRNTQFTDVQHWVAGSGLGYAVAPSGCPQVDVLVYQNTFLGGATPVWQQTMWSIYDPTNNLCNGSSLADSGWIRYTANNQGGGTAPLVFQNQQLAGAANRPNIFALIDNFSTNCDTRDKLFGGTVTFTNTVVHGSNETFNGQTTFAGNTANFSGYASFSGQYGILQTHDSDTIQPIKVTGTPTRNSTWLVQCQDNYGDGYPLLDWTMLPQHASSNCVTGYGGFGYTQIQNQAGDLWQWGSLYTGNKITSSNGFASYATNQILIASSTTISNSQAISMTVWLTAATGLSMTNSAGVPVFSGQTVAALTPFTLQPKAQLVGTAITCVGTNAW